MSLQNELRKQNRTNLEFKARRLRDQLKSLAATISINLDTSLRKPEETPVLEVDAQWDEYKAVWGELLQANADIERLNEELA